MSDAGAPSPPRRWPDYTRWGVCFALAFTFHAAGAMALLARWNDDSDLVANAPVIMIDLAPAPVAPAIVPTELPPGPVESQAQPEPQPEPVQEKPVEKTEIEPEPVPVQPVEKLDLKPQPTPQPELSVMPPPKPVEKPKEKEAKKPKRTKQASLASAPSTAEQRAERAAAPMPGASSNNPNAVPSWKSRLVAQLERNKRYPSDAQSRGDQGVVQLAFSIDRSGGVHHARIVRSSGSSALDEATLALVARAAPLPPPPPELSGAQIAIVVPIRYNIR
jgi:protein TonB